MKRVIQFSNARYFFFAFSLLLMLAGVIGYFVNGGFNLGVDFKAGIALQFQIAPASFTVSYAGADKAEISIPAGEEALTSAGNIIISIISAKDGTRTDYPFRYAGFKSVRELTDAIAKVPGVSVQQKGDMEAVPTQLLPLVRPQDISANPASINLSPGPGRGVQASIAEVRAALAPLGQSDLQAVGAPVSQEFITRLAAKGTEKDFQVTTEANVRQALESRFGAGQIILKRSDFVGPRVAQSLGTQAIWLVFIAVLLILIYMMFRFRPPIFAVAAVIGIMHDALVMLAFDAVFRIEIDAATIAAILTILGYSINDTIVIFDRVRENKNLMRGTPLRSILDTSVTQTLSRTFITSGATLLTVISLFALTSGSMKNFSLNMIIGIVEGTYSTFISSFIVLEWTNMRERSRKRRELVKYGIGSADAAPAKVVARIEAAEAEAGEEGELVAEPMPLGFAAQTAGSGEPIADSATPAPLSSPEAPQQPRPASGNVVPFSGQSGARKNKKHKRRHH
jgi:preprotein translocase subunit SecF